jgi:hypothetical protein
MYSSNYKFLTVVVFMFCFCAGLKSQYSFTTEWQSPICYGDISIAQYECSNNIPEIILSDETLIKIYDGATKNMKYTFPNDGSRFRNFTEIWTIYSSQSLDVNNDEVNEFVMEKSGYDSLNNDWYLLKVKDGASGQTLFQNTYNGYYRNCYALDIDKDSYTELCVMLYHYDYYTSYSKLVIISTTSQAIGINGNNETVSNYILKQNYPNPFNPYTTIEFSIPKQSDVKILIYDVLGREVKTIPERKYAGGKHKIPFDGSNLASGTYFYQVIIDKIPLTKKMILIK